MVTRTQAAVLAAAAADRVAYSRTMNAWFITPGGVVRVATIVALERAGLAVRSCGRLRVLTAGREWLAQHTRDVA